MTATLPNYQPSTSPLDFDHADLLNEDGTVTLRMTPSAWHVHNIAPDTYQMFNGDSWVESELYYLNEDEGTLAHFGEEYEALAAEVDRLGTTLTYDHFTWDYDHAGIVRDLAGELANWLAVALTDAGLSCSVEVVDTWSPAYCNFTSDGFEVKVTCDPMELRALTPDFDVDDWARDHYQSRDGFLPFVTSRMNDTDWHAEYDGGFRVESLLAEWDVERDWIMTLAEAEWDIYSQNVTITPREDAIRKAIGYEESGYTLGELEEWAGALLAEYQAGMDPLPEV